MVDIGWLIENGPCKKFVAGSNIPCPGGPDPAQRAMYILLVGRVDVLKKSAAGGTQIIASLLKGDVFGGREYFINADDCTYIAGVDSAVYVLTEESFNDISWSRPEIVFEILRAAYMPMRKMSAASRGAQQEKKAASAKNQDATQAQDAQAQVAKQAQTATKGAAKSTSAGDAPMAAANAEKKPSVKAKATKNDPKEIYTTEESLFPPGHKRYSDITRPEYLPLIFQKEYKCPCCKESFKDYRVFRSKLFETIPMRYDLRKYFRDFQTEWYDILTCHRCLFSTFHNYFTDPKPIQKAKIEINLLTARSEVIMDFDAERDLDYVFTAHYLGIVCADGYPSMGKQIRAKLWGNLSWLYEDVENKEMEKYAAAKAAEAYEQVYTESRLTPVQEQITCLSIAGMQHRAGLDNNLKKFLFTAKTQASGDRTYAKLAEDFMYELDIE